MSRLKILSSKYYFSYFSISIICYFLITSISSAQIIPIKKPFLGYQLSAPEKKLATKIVDLKKEQNYNQVIDFLIKQKSKFTNQVFYNYSYAELLFLLEKKQEMLNYLTDLIEKEKSESTKYQYLALRGVFLLKSNYRLSAFEDLSQAYNKKVNDLNFLLHFYSFLTYNPAYIKIQYSVVVKALRQDNRNDLLWFEKAKIEDRLNDKKLAKESIENAIKINPQKKYYSLLAKIDDKKANPQNSEQRLLQLIKKYPKELSYYKEYFNLQQSRSKQKELQNFLENKLAELKDISNEFKANIYFLLAQNNIALNEKEKAIAYYIKGIELTNNKDPIKLILAHLLWNQNESKAVNYLKELFESSYRAVFVYRALSNYYNEKDQSLSAQDVILKGLSLYPKDPIILEEYSLLLEKTRQYQKAIRATKELLTIKSDEVKYLTNLGKLYTLVGNYKKGEEDLQKSLTLQESNVTRYHLANNYYLQDNNKLAIQNLALIIKQGEAEYWVYRLKAIIEYELDNYTQALADITEAIDLVKDPSVYMKQLQVENLLRLHKLDEAEQTLIKYKKDTDYFVLERQRIVLLFLKKDPTALAAIENYLNKNSSTLLLLEILHSLKKTSKKIWQFSKLEEKIYQNILSYKLVDAKKMLEKNSSQNGIFLKYLLADIEDKDGDFLKKIKAQTGWQSYYLGSYFLEQEKYLQSTKIFESALNQKQKSIWIYPKLAQAYEKLQNYSKSIAALQIFLKEYPNNSWALLRLALVYDLDNQAVSAEKIYLKILEQEPEDSLALNNLSWLYLTKKKSPENAKKALVLAKKAVAIDSNPANLDTLAEAYHQNQENDEALKLIEKALTIDDENLDHFKQQRSKFLEALENSKEK